MKSQYRIRNWSEYNAGLKQRGSLTFWIEESVLEAWMVDNLSGKPGASRLYSDGYHRRSIAETTMFRLKTIFGGNLSARKFDNQAVELFIKCAALNRMIQTAKPDSYEVAA